MKKNEKKHRTTASTVAATSGAIPAATSNGAPVGAAASPSTAPPTGTSSGNIPIELQALEQSCGYGDPLPDDVRETSEKLVRRVPSTIVDRIIALAVRGNGVVAGITFDPNAAKAALASADDADAVATAGQMLVRRAQDQSIRLRAGVTGDVSAIRTALRGYVKTAQGASLAQENDELRALAKQAAAARKARKTRAENSVTAEEATPAPEPTTASAATSAPTPTPPLAPKAS